MKTYLQFFLLFFIAASNSICSAQTPNWIWAEGSSGAGVVEAANGISLDQHGNIFMYGACEQTTTFDGFSISGGPINSFTPWAGKLDTSGNVNWLESDLNTLEGDVPKGFWRDANDNVYITGSGQVNGHNATFIEKYDSAGVVQMLLTMGHGQIGVGGITTDNSGNIYITGNLSNGKDTLGSTILNYPGDQYGIFIAKLNSSGNFIWAKEAYGSGSGDGLDYGNCIALDNNGHLYIDGSYTGTPTFGAITAPTCIGQQNLYVAKYDTSGNVIWVTTAVNNVFPTNDYEGLVADNCGNVYVAGSYQYTGYFGNSPITIAGNSNSDFFVAKCNPNGGWEWVEASNSTTISAGESVALDKDNDVYIGGNYYESSIAIGSTTITGGDVYLAKFSNSNGALQWVQTATTNHGDINGIAIDYNKYIYLDGDFGGNYTFGNNTAKPGGADQIFLTKLDTVVTRKIIPVLSSSYCIGSKSALSFKAVGSFNVGNVFTAQLSDSTGSFINAVNIGDTTLSSNGTITITIPSNTLPGSTYLIRIVSSNPSVSSYASCNNYITIGSGINLIVTPPDISICSGASTILTATGAGIYTWSPATGLNATTGSSVTADPTVTTTYTVMVANGCSATNTATVMVNPLPTITTSASPVSYCNGGSSTLTASGGSTYTWSPSTGLSVTTGSSVTANPTVTTTYTVTGVNSTGCSATNTVTVTVNPNPTINASEKPSSYCAGGSSVFMVSGGTTYTWSPSIGLSATTGSSVTASPTVSTVYTVTGKNVYGCIGTRSGKVTVNALPIVSVTPTSLALCNGSSSTLKVSGATTYAWSPSAGLSNTTGTSLTVNPTVTTTYTVNGTNSSGCIGTKTVTVTVNPVPVLSASESPSSICAGSSSVLKVAGATTYTWAPATGLSATTGTSVTADPSITTTYTVTGTNTFGCSAKKSGKLTVSVCGTGGSDMVDEDSSGTTTTSGISQLPGFSNQILIYPNPTSSTVFVKINSGVLNVSDWTLRLTDVLGRTLYAKQSLNYNNEIDLSNLPSGIYFVTVVNKTDRTVFKVVKQS